MPETSVVSRLTLHTDYRGKCVTIVIDGDQPSDEVIRDLKHKLETDLPASTRRCVKAVDILADNGPEVMQVRFELDKDFDWIFEMHIQAVVHRELRAT